MKKQFLLLMMLLLPVVAGADNAATQPKTNIFEVKNPDLQLSPFTGMTRDHWKQAAEYLLATAFQYVDSIQQPFDLPKQEGKSYLPASTPQRFMPTW